MEHVDVQVGKIVDAIEALGQRENTLIIYCVGDNGPSAEGSLTGTLNNMKAQQGFPDDVAAMLQKIDKVSSPRPAKMNDPFSGSVSRSSPLK